ncbi:maleylacetoacetate isomerase [Phascolomyces articulosus]|uniref:Maleylacetoacetate isomerase n=1 Tax=Phascolomyces articulosus TaxID=60185 RepID=A0AAD5K8D4_9FUNG|nr:maleylacetoacetate isomerase [Phascolomyces articulosus]
MPEEKKPVLFGYYRSSATWRVRLALAWKGIEYEYKPINLLKQEQKSDEFAKVNPSKKLPALILPNGNVLTQSIAIVEYIEDAHPERPFLPKDPYERALVREIVNEIGCDIHPLQNPGLLVEIAPDDADKRSEWARVHILRGFQALESKLKAAGKTEKAKYCVGDNVTMADFVLMPQFYNGRRFNVDVSELPIINSIQEHLMTLPEFKATAPENQADCPQ